MDRILASGKRAEAEALAARHQKSPEVRTRLAESSVFGQAFKQLRNVPASRLRVKRVKGEPFVGLEVRAGPRVMVASGRVTPHRGWV